MSREKNPRERHAERLKRKKATKKGYDRILVVCEGSKTEPNYFNEIRAHYKLHTASVKVLPSLAGTSPIQIVDYAHELFDKGNPQLKIIRRAFEQVYVVFDRDEHLSYHNALNRAVSLEKSKLLNDEKVPIIFRAIVSVPNFELWLLLHYKLISHVIDRTDVIKQLKKEIRHYEKGKRGYFQETRDMLSVACENAEKLMARHSPYHGAEPYTNVCDLVNILKMLKET